MFMCKYKCTCEYAYIARYKDVFLQKKGISLSPSVQIYIYVNIRARALLASPCEYKCIHEYVYRIG